MPAPLIWAGIGLAAIYGTGWAARQMGDTFENASTLTKTAMIGGGVYVSYRILKAKGLV